MTLFLAGSIAGTHTFEDDGTVGNNRSRIRDPNGVTFAFDHPGDELFFAAQTTGVSLIVDLADSLGSARFKAGESGYARLSSVEIRNLLTSGTVTLDADHMTGGSGTDWYIVRNASDMVVEQAGGAADQVYSYVNWTLGAGQQVEFLATYNQTTNEPINLTGNELIQTIYGNAGNNSLDSGGGSDALVGLDGNDKYYVRQGYERIFETGAGGSLDQVFAYVDYRLTAGAAIDDLSAADPTATTPLYLIGNEFTQNIYGNRGDNTLDGGGGGDVLSGSGGADTYIIRNALDRIIEGLSGSSNDRALTHVSYTLPAAVGIEVLAVADPGSTDPINLTGNEYNEALIGNAGANWLDTKIGPDWMTGGAGADVFAFTSTFGGGTDQILDFEVGIDKIYIGGVTITSDNFRIGFGAQDADDRFYYMPTSHPNSSAPGGTLVYDDDGNGPHSGTRVAVLQGAPHISGNDMYGFVGDPGLWLNGTANSETLSGAGGQDYLDGAAGNDTLNGGAGSDYLDGGAGNDAMYGGTGDNDWFVVRDAGDQVFEAAGEGAADTVTVGVNWTLTAGQHVEFVKAGLVNTTTPFTITGNELSQRITGMSGNDILDGGGGGDILDGGGGGADTYIIRNAADQVVEPNYGGSGDKVLAAVTWTLSNGVFIEELATIDASATAAINLTGNDLATRITGNAGANRIDGKIGADTLGGGGGADTFAFTAALGGGVHTILDFETGIDKIAFGGVTPAQLLAGAFHEGTAAHDADDRIIYHQPSGALFYDGDGIGGLAQIQFATLQGSPVLTANDFAMI